MSGRQPLRARVAAGEQLLGVIVRMPNEALVELAGLAGLDFVVLDTEHGPGDQVELLHHLLAAEATGLSALVRVADRGEVLRALDLGAEGIVVPHVSSAAQAAEAARAAHYPPEGTRGLATYTRAGRYGLADPVAHVRAAGETTVVVVMVEDAAGVESAAEIASTPGVDAVFVGPADLAHDLGRTGDTAAPEVRGAIERVHVAARAAGRKVLTIAGDAATARVQLERGSDLVVYNLQAMLAALLGELAAPRPRPGSPVGGPAAGEPLVLLPGMLGDAALFEPFLAALGDRRPFELGRTDLDDKVGGAADSVLASAPARFCLLGHSLGGIVDLEVARRAPERVARLVLVNSTARPPRPDQLADWQELRRRVTAGQFAAVVEELARGNLAPGADERLVGIGRAMGRRVGPDGLVRELDAQAGREDLRPVLASLAMPALVVSGGRDSVCPPDAQHELAAGLPRAERCTIAVAGHLTPLEAPDELARAVGRFLDGVSPAEGW